MTEEDFRGCRLIFIRYHPASQPNSIQYTHANMLCKHKRETQCLDMKSQNIRGKSTCIPTCLIRWNGKSRVYNLCCLCRVAPGSGSRGKRKLCDCGKSGLSRFRWGRLGWKWYLCVLS